MQLLGTTFEERQLILQSQCEGTYEPDHHQTRVSDYVSVAENLVGQFDQVFDALLPEDEGLVLKNPSGRLRSCFREGTNTGWQVKCRITAANYSF